MVNLLSGDSSGIDSSDEEYIPLNDLELNDSEDKSEYYKMTEQLRLDAFEVSRAFNTNGNIS